MSSIADDNNFEALLGKERLYYLEPLPEQIITITNLLDRIVGDSGEVYWERCILDEDTERIDVSRYFKALSNNGELKPTSQNVENSNPTLKSDSDQNIYQDQSRKPNAAVVHIRTELGILKVIISQDDMADYKYDCLAPEARLGLELPDSPLYYSQNGSANHTQLEILSRILASTIIMSHEREMLSLTEQVIQFLERHIDIQQVWVEPEVDDRTKIAGAESLAIIDTIGAQEGFYLRQHARVNYQEGKELQIRRAIPFYNPSPSVYPDPIVICHSIYYGVDSDIKSTRQQLEFKQDGSVIYTETDKFRSNPQLFDGDVTGVVYEGKFGYERERRHPLFDKNACAADMEKIINILTEVIMGGTSDPGHY